MIDAARVCFPADHHSIDQTRLLRSWRDDGDASSRATNNPSKTSITQMIAGRQLSGTHGQNPHWRFCAHSDMWLDSASAKLVSYQVVRFQFASTSLVSRDSLIQNKSTTTFSGPKPAAAAWAQPLGACQAPRVSHPILAACPGRRPGKYRRATCHLSEVSMGTALTRRITDPPSGNMPTTLVRRLTSLLSLSYAGVG